MTAIVLKQDPNTKEVQRNAIYLDKTQLADFRGNSLCQARKFAKILSFFLFFFLSPFMCLDVAFDVRYFQQHTNVKGHHCNHHLISNYLFPNYHYVIVMNFFYATSNGLVTSKEQFYFQ